MKKSFLLISLFITKIYAVTWSPVENISGDLTDVSQANVLIDSTGNRLVVWETQSIIQSIEGVNSWSSPQDIFVGAGVVQNGPYLIGNSTGDAILYFLANETGYSICKICEYTNSTWGSPQTLSSPDKNCYQPNFSILPSSNAGGIWIEQDTEGVLVKAGMKNSGTWSLEDVSSTVGSYSYPSIGLVSSGEAPCTWLNKAENYYQIYTSLFSNDAWSSAVQLSEVFQTVLSPVLSVSPNGFGMAAWVELMDKSWNVKAAFWENNSWSTPTLISILGENDQNPSIAINNNGLAICVWERRQKGILNIFYSIFSNNTWGSPQPLCQSSFNSTNPKVFLNNSDQAVVIWNSSVYEQEKVLSCIYNNDTWSTAETLTPDTETKNCFSPDASINDSGDVTVVWIVGSSLPMENNSVQFTQTNLNN